MKELITLDTHVFKEDIETALRNDFPNISENDWECFVDKFEDSFNELGAELAENLFKEFMESKIILNDF